MSAPQRVWSVHEVELPSYKYGYTLTISFLRARAEDKIPNTIVFESYTKSVVLTYLYTDPDADVNLEFCRQNGIEVARCDATVGPTWWYDAGMLGLGGVIDTNTVEDFPKDVSSMYEFLIKPVAEKIRERFGVNAYHAPINDLEIDGKKVAGLGMIPMGNIVGWDFGFQLKPLNFELIENACPPPPEKFMDKEAKSARERSAGFEEILKRKVSKEEIKEIYLEAMKEAFGVELVEKPLPAVVWEYYTFNAMHKYFRDDWIFERSPKKLFADVPKDAKRGYYATKIKHGPLIRPTVYIKDNRIEAIAISGSVKCKPIDLILRMEQALKGVEATEEAVRKAIEKVVEETNADIGYGSPDDYINAIMKAIENAKTS